MILQHESLPAETLREEAVTVSLLRLLAEHLDQSTAWKEPCPTLVHTKKEQDRSLQIPFSLVAPFRGRRYRGKSKCRAASRLPDGAPRSNPSSVRVQKSRLNLRSAPYPHLDMTQRPAAGQIRAAGHLGSRATSTVRA